MDRPAGTPGTHKNIILSEKALSELEYLINTVRYLAGCIRSILINRDDKLIQYVITTANNLENTAAIFAQEHRDRLSSGMCQPQASAYFIDLLNTLKEYSYQFKEMGRQIASLPSDSMPSGQIYEQNEAPLP
jgi:Na+/phosphate symporter